MINNKIAIIEVIELLFLTVFNKFYRLLPNHSYISLQNEVELLILQIYHIKVGTFNKIKPKTITFQIGKLYIKKDLTNFYNSLFCKIKFLIRIWDGTFQLWRTKTIIKTPISVYLLFYAFNPRIIINKWTFLKVRSNLKKMKIILFS